MLVDHEGALTGEGGAGRLVGVIAAGLPLPDPYTVRIFAPLPDVGEPTERMITVDQTNRSVVVGEQVVVKWMAEDSGSARAPELLGHLAAVGFRRTPRLYAAVFREHALAAMVTEFLPEARDGWEWCVDAVQAELSGAPGPGPGFAAELGELAADLHAALATPSELCPAPVVAGPLPGSEPARATLAEAITLTDGADGEWLRAGEPQLRDQLAVPAGPGRDVVPQIRIHGDLHVGQVLRWRDGYAVIDFDGNPTLDGAPALDGAAARQPAARDVAQLLTSLEHVAQIAVGRGTAPQPALAWARSARRACLDAYTARLAEHGKAELFDARLLRPYEIEQECRELIYAARFLPRWRYAPMGVLRSWFAPEGDML
jgi:maltokinase